MCGEADGYCDVYDSRDVVARKDHACMACHETIASGHTYRKTDSLYDGSWEHWKHCLRCWAIFDAIQDAMRDAYGPIAIEPGLDCGERWEDNFGPPPPEVEALAFALPGDEIARRVGE